MMGHVKITRGEFISQFDCNATGSMTEYVGCKFDRNFHKKLIKFTQSVMIQSCKDKFVVNHNKIPKTPAETGSILKCCRAEKYVGQAKQKIYRSGVVKLLHMMRWSCPDILNAVRELSKHMKEASIVHMKAMYRVMIYAIHTPTHELTLKPTGHWECKDKEYLFRINGKSDADYAKDPDNCCSIRGIMVFLNNALVTIRSRQRACVTLSIMEADLYVATICAQDMLYVYQLLKLMGFCV